MRRSVRAVALALSALLGVAFPGFAAGTAELLADIDSTRSSGSVSGIGQLIPLGDRLLFLADEPSSGSELWVSDGTPLGTRLLLDLEPGTESSELAWVGTVGRTALFGTPSRSRGPATVWSSRLGRRETFRRFCG